MRYGYTGRYVAYSLKDGSPLAEGETPEAVVLNLSKTTLDFAIIYTSYSKLKPFTKRGIVHKKEIEEEEED